jgi:hypothetical protein
MGKSVRICTSAEQHGTGTEGSRREAAQGAETWAGASVGRRRARAYLHSMQSPRRRERRMVVQWDIWFAGVMDGDRGWCPEGAGIGDGVAMGRQVLIRHSRELEAGRNGWRRRQAMTDVVVDECWEQGMAARTTDGVHANGVSSQCGREPKRQAIRRRPGQVPPGVKYVARYLRTSLILACPLL